MDIVVCGDFEPGERDAWLDRLAPLVPGARWFDAADAPTTVCAAVVANPPPGALERLPQLGLIQSLWAGVDRLLADPTLPAGVPLARLVDPALGLAMAETALWAVLALHRGFFAYGERQRRGFWQVHAQRPAAEVRVAVLGAGEMGRAVAGRLASNGYPVTVWRRSGATLHALLAACDSVVSVLPLTAATRDLVDARFFDALPPGAGFVNLGRGEHVVDADLLAALASGRLRHAVLDVFRTEPLPAGHPFWTHPQVTVLPHVAAWTDPRSAAAVVAQNLNALRDGRPLQHLVDRSRGY